MPAQQATCAREKLARPTRWRWEEISNRRQPLVGPNAPDSSGTAAVRRSERCLASYAWKLMGGLRVKFAFACFSIQEQLVPITVITQSAYYALLPRIIESCFRSICLHNAFELLNGSSPALSCKEKHALNHL